MKENIFSYRVWGRKALITDPIMRVSGEKTSLMVPTYEAIKGITESIYWKPTIIIRPLRIRVMNQIKLRPEGIRPIGYNGGNTLSVYTYLQDVCYQVEAKFIWNESRPDLAADRDENKHFFVMKRMIEKGGRRDIFLGTRECAAYVEPCNIDDGKGYYDHVESVDLGIMYHGIDYPGDRPELGDIMRVRLWHAVMKNGIIEFPTPEECTMVREIKKSEMKTFTLGKNMASIDELFGEVSLDELEQSTVSDV